jgi:hypothetical protein
VIATVTADATGSFRVELTDETKFLFGDQMGVVSKDNGGKSSRPLIVPTEPFMVTNLTTNFRSWNGGPITRTDVTSSMQALSPNTDDRAPFYQDALVKKVASEPKAAGEPWTLQITGADDAVEPNSTISVQIGSETFSTKAADDGTFALKLAGFTPGQRLKLQVRDVNGKGVDLPLVAPNVAFNQPRIAGSVTVAPSLTPPTGMREVVGPNGGADGPFIAMKATDVTVPFGAVVVKNTTTGDVFELTADDKGSISAAVGGISEFDVLQIATRDANGNFSPSTSTMVIVPEKVAYGQLLVPVEQLKTNLGHNLQKLLESIEGPPHDLFIKRGSSEVKDTRGPFLALPAVKGLPPFGQIAVVRDGVVTQTLRADKDGVVKGYLRGVNGGDRLDFRVLDAAGRRFGEGVVGYEVPSSSTRTKLTDVNINTPSEARALKNCVELVGSGKLNVEHAWVQPFTVGAQANPPTETSFKLHYSPLVFGAQVGRPVTTSPDAPPQQIIEQLPAALAQKFGTSPAVSIAVTESNGTQVIAITAGNPQHGMQRVCTVGVDYVVGNVNGGSFSTPLTQANLPQIEQGLKAAYALLAAAYDQGKEPGDLVYDRAMSTAKTLMYVLDRFVVANPTLSAEAKQVAVNALPADFNFELFARDLVPPDAQKQPLADVTGKRTSTMSLIEARQAALGRMEQKLPPPSTGGMTPPRVDQAAVLRNGQNNVASSPVVVRGRGTPGDVVQVYNVSVGARHLLGEALVQPDGRYELVTTGQGAMGDQFGVMSTSRDGKQRSRMSVVPTDAYQWDGANMSSAAPIGVQQFRDERAPLLSPSHFSLANTSFDEKGAVRDGGPFWRLTSADFGVEPNSTIIIEGKRPDGTTVNVEVRADDQGRFAIEFPFPARASFRVDVLDARRTRASVQMMAPGLTESTSVTGDRAAEAATGAVTLLVGGVSVKGVLVATSLGDADVSISSHDRSDGFVDVVVVQQYEVQYQQGINTQNVKYRVKVPAAEAKQFSAGVNDHITLQGAVLENPSFNDEKIIGARLTGTARILDRDYLLSTDN